MALILAADTYIPDPSYGMTFNNSTLTSRDATFLVPDGVRAVRGGFRIGQAVDPADPVPLGSASVLSGDIGVTGFESDNCFHTVVVNDVPTQRAVEFHDLIISDGHADDLSHGLTVPPLPGTGVPVSGVLDAIGGGVLVLDSGVKFVDCVLRDNYAIWGGGLFASSGFDVASGADVRSVGLTVRDNLAGRDGGGYYANRGIQSILGNSLFRSNQANYDGGGAYRRSGLVDYEINNSVFHDNGAAQRGGAIYFDGVSNGVTEGAFIVNCTVAHNDAEEGAGLYFAAGFDPKTLTFAGDVMRVDNTITFQNPPTNNDGNVVIDPASQVIAENSFLGAPTVGLLGTRIVASPSGGAPTIFDAGVPGSPLVPGWSSGAARDYRLTSSSVCIDEGNDFLLRSDRVDADDDTDLTEAYPREFLMVDEALVPSTFSTREVAGSSSGTPLIGIDGGNVTGAICDIGAFEFRLLFSVPQQ